MNINKLHKDAIYTKYGMETFCVWNVAWVQEVWIDKIPGSCYCKFNSKKGAYNE